MKVQDKTSKFYIPQLKLESGELLENVEIAYTTYGTLSKKGDNAVLIFHALTGDQFVSGINPLWCVLIILVFVMGLLGLIQ